MGQRSIVFRLPVTGYPRAVFETDYGYREGRLCVDGVLVVETSSREELAAGVQGRLPESDIEIRARLREAEGKEEELEVTAEGVAALREDRLVAPTSRSAWIHASQALAGSAFGFLASWLYLERARATGDPWPLKMATHMAAWHLLLVLTLFPASAWGQRVGIRAVQFVSLVFFAIHAGIAIANLASSGSIDPAGPWIALCNGLSGAFFLVATIYGNRAHRDMDPVAALLAGEPGPAAASRR
jgi:hypothetical protein